MNRSVLFLQVGAVLAEAAWLGTTSPHELLPAPAPTAQFQVSLDQMSQSGGCLTEISVPCPAWEDPNSEDALCGCTGPNDTNSCSPAEAQGEDEEGATLWSTVTQYYNGIGFGGSIWTPTLCTAFYTCQPGCNSSAFGEEHSCNTEQVSGFGADSYRGDTDNYQWCDAFYAQQARESQQSAQLAMVSGIGLQLFSAE